MLVLKDKGRFGCCLSAAAVFLLLRFTHPLFPCAAAAATWKQQSKQLAKVSLHLRKKSTHTRDKQSKKQAFIQKN